MIQNKLQVDPIFKCKNMESCKYMEEKKIGHYFYNLSKGRPKYGPQLETTKVNIDYFKQNYLCSTNMKRSINNILEKYLQQNS